MARLQRGRERLLGPSRHARHQLSRPPALEGPGARVLIGTIEASRSARPRRRAAPRAALFCIGRHARPPLQVTGSSVAASGSPRAVSTRSRSACRRMVGDNTGRDPRCQRRLQGASSTAFVGTSIRSAETHSRAPAMAFIENDRQFLPCPRLGSRHGSGESDQRRRARHMPFVGSAPRARRLRAHLGHLGRN